MEERKVSKRVLGCYESAITREKEPSEKKIRKSSVVAKCAKK